MGVCTSKVLVRMNENVHLKIRITVPVRSCRLYKGSRAGEYKCVLLFCLNSHFNSSILKTTRSGTIMQSESTKGDNVFRFLVASGGGHWGDCKINH